MVTREELYALVWSQPMIKAAERYDVSGTYLARVCTLLNVPRPPRGHWQKLAVGKRAPQEPLPEALPGDQVTWNEKGGPLPAPTRMRPVRATPAPRRSLRRSGKAAEDTHPLIRGTLGEYRRSRPVKSWDYLRPYKKLLPDIVASDAVIERALNVASKLYNELEAQGARVVIAPADQQFTALAIDEREVPKAERGHRYYGSMIWSPMRQTIAFFENTAIGIAVLEMSENLLLQYIGDDRGFDGYIPMADYQANLRKYGRLHTWTTNMDIPCGRLRIVAFSSDAAGWSKSWQEKGETTIDAALQRIAKEIRGAIPEVINIVEEARHQAEIRHQAWLADMERWQRKEDLRHIEESTKESREALGKVIERWADRMAVERFFDELSQSIDKLPDDERSAMMARLRLAREFMGTVDPIQYFKKWRTPREIYVPKFE